MNYRHAYHAGNACDVVKHVILVLLLGLLREKEKPFAVLDTHAGCGFYDLNDEKAQKTREAEEGIGRLWQKNESLKSLENKVINDYLQILDEINPDGQLRFYPGSPDWITRLLRAQDRLMVCELHPEDNALLYAHMKEKKGVQIHRRDGYEALRGLVPFPEKRGLVFIDPPFEVTDEFDRLIISIKEIRNRMSNAVIAVWYPIKERPAIWRFHEQLAQTKKSADEKILIAEYLFHSEVRHDRLNGSGMVFINPPWKLAEETEKLFGILRPLLGSGDSTGVLKEI